MNEFLSTLLQAVIIAAVPVCAGAIVNGIRALAKHLSTQTDSELARKYLADAADAITTAVSLVNQTYVDGLKKSGTFTKKNQEEALSRAIKEAVNLMTHETIVFLKEAYGDMNDYLVSKIEAEVRLQKQNDPAALGIPLESIESVRETPDTSAIATATAAATAAATAVVVSQNTIPQVTPTSAPDSPQEGGATAVV